MRNVPLLQMLQYARRATPPRNKFHQRLLPPIHLQLQRLRHTIRTNDTRQKKRKRPNNIHLTWRNRRHSHKPETLPKPHPRIFRFLQGKYRNIIKINNVFLLHPLTIPNKFISLPHQNQKNGM